MDCKHEQFEAFTRVARLTDDETADAPITGFSADIKINCLQCGLPFEFIGLPCGVSSHQPMVSIDKTELRAPIRPSSDPVENVKTILK